MWWHAGKDLFPEVQHQQHMAKTKVAQLIKDNCFSLLLNLQGHQDEVTVALHLEVRRASQSSTPAQIFSFFLSRARDIACLPNHGHSVSHSADMSSSSAGATGSLLTVHFDLQISTVAAMGGVHGFRHAVWRQHHGTVAPRLAGCHISKSD